MSNLATWTLDYIVDPSVPLIWPGLAGRLVDDLSRVRGIDLASYSTSKWITGGAISPKRLIAVRNARRVGTQSWVEVLSPTVQQRYYTCGCRFWEDDELAQSSALDLLALALNEIAEVPVLADSVDQLARRIHLLMPRDDAYDINFSEPELPLSVFISVPRRPLEQMRWRVAEAIIHEASHLQLTLIECIVPLIASPKAQHYSPWRKVARSVRGVLHGLYVFGVIAEWMTRCSAPNPDVRKRLADIAREVKQIDDLPEANGLTHAGAALARSILSRISVATHFPIATKSEYEETFQESP